MMPFSLSMLWTKRSTSSEGSVRTTSPEFLSITVMTARFRTSSTLKDSAFETFGSARSSSATFSRIRSNEYVSFGYLEAAVLDALYPRHLLDRLDGGRVHGLSYRPHHHPNLWGLQFWMDAQSLPWLLRGTGLDAVWMVKSSPDICNPSQKKISDWEIGCKQWIFNLYLCFYLSWLLRR